MSRGTIIRLYIGLLLIFVLGIRSYYVKHPILVGHTMGTEYSVTIKGYVSRSAIKKIQRTIEGQLVEINRQMSTWDPDSEISQFNAWEKSGPFPVSPAFADVVTRALEFSDSTSGAFDPTMQPLLNLWGFGSESAEKKIPSDEEIENVLANTGAELIWIEDGTNLWKAAPEVNLNLGAIAKGHGVDILGQALTTAGFESWFVEIGGEVAVRGLNPAGNPWRVGIQYPSSDPTIAQLHGILHLTNGAAATSGDTQNYIEHEGKLYAHIIEPWTGQAILTNTASVTVVAPTCLDADAVATALFVLGVDEGLVWVEEHPEAEAMFLVRNEDGTLAGRFSSGFEALTGYVSANETNE
jgi:thiamine biosynthesis lipoprotein